MCGLFGVVAYRNKNTDLISKMVMSLGKESEVRGTDAGGLSFIVKGSGLTSVRNAGAISKSGVFKYLNENKVVMGHTRMTTQGTASHAYNNHPFPSKVGGYTMAHNGVIYNDKTLAKTHNLPDTKVETDSYIVVRMIDHLYGGVINFDTLRAVAEQLEGQFNLTFQTGNGIWIVRHNNPLEIINLESEGMYVYASTRDILIKAIKSYFDTPDLLEFLMAHKGDRVGEMVKTNSGDILYISNSGTIERGSFTPKPATYTRSYADDYDDYYYAGHKYQPSSVYDTKTQTWVKPNAQTPIKRVETDPLKVINDRCKSYYKSGAVFYNGSESEVGILYTAGGGQFYYSSAKGKSLAVDNEKVFMLTDLSYHTPLSKPRLDSIDMNLTEFYNTLKLFYSSPSYTRLLGHLNAIGKDIASFSTTVMPFITHYLFYTACQLLNADNFYQGNATIAGIDQGDIIRLFDAEAERLSRFAGVQALYMHVAGHLHMFDDEVLEYLTQG
jgi:predicted glutamine amidotransferase